MTEMQWAVVIAGAGLGTYALRVAPFLSERLYRVGQKNLRFLTYVSFAIAAGIVSHSIVFSAGAISNLGAIAIKVAAVLAAMLFYRFVRNMALAVFFGAGVAVLLKWLSL